MTVKPAPVLIRKTDVPAVYGLSERQIKRKVFDGDLSHVHPSGDRGPCFLLVAELDELIAASTTRKKRSKKATPGKTTGAER